MTKKKTYKKESDLVADMRKTLANWFGGRWIKIHGGPYQEKGLPDILGCLEGRFIAIEVKLPGKEKTLTPSQDKFLESITLAGGIAFMSSSIAYSLDQIGGVFHGKSKGSG